MIQTYKIVTLCGSTRFKEQFIEAQKRLTLEGCIVISVGLFGHSGDEEVWKPGTKEMLDDMHKRKIDLADEIFVIRSTSGRLLPTGRKNVGGYIGESTKREIVYVEKTGKKVNYLEPIVCLAPRTSTRQVASESPDKLPDKFNTKNQHIKTLVRIVGKAEVPADSERNDAISETD